MKERTVETMFIIGLFGLVSSAVSHYFTGIAVVLAYLAITAVTTLALTVMDKAKATK